MDTSDGRSSSTTRSTAPAFEPKDEIAKALEVASELCAVEDPQSEPFRSKYKAREVLRKVRQKLAAGEITVSLFGGTAP